MDNFEEALNKAKEVATAALKKTEEAINIQKKKIPLQIEFFSSEIKTLTQRHIYKKTRLKIQQKI